MPLPNKVRVLLADDHPIVRAGLREALLAIPTVDLVGEAADGREVLEKVRGEKVDLVLLDLSMPGLNGLEVLKRLTKEIPRVKVLIFSTHADEEHVWACLRARAAGYMHKGCMLTELPQAIESVMAGDVYLSREIGRHFKLQLGRIAQTETPVASLTKRQVEVLTLLAEAKTTKEIALVLGLSPKSVEYHRRQLMNKLQTTSQVELALWAQRQGLVG
jgi:DNA-binding NarL/FixJ family response regulator